MSSDSLSPIEAARNILAEKNRKEEEASELVEGLAIEDENDEVITLEDNDYEEFDEDEEDQDNLEEESPEMKPKKPSMAGEKGALSRKTPLVSLHSMPQVREQLLVLKPAPKVKIRLIKNLSPLNLLLLHPRLKSLI